MPHEQRSPTGRSVARFLRNRLAVAGLALLCCFGTLSLFSYTLPADAHGVQDLESVYRPPLYESPGGRLHLLGTDSNGRDLFARILVGSRLSFAVGFAGAAVSLLIGVGYGAIAGYAGGRVETLMMRLVDVLYGLPYMILVILLVSIFRRSFVVLFVAIGSVQWLTMSRIVRGQVVGMRGSEFVLSAVSLGASHPRILLRHILPNLAGIVIAYATLTVPSIMLQDAFLSFLGLGLEDSWGRLVADAVNNISPLAIRWWVVFFPSAALVLVLWSLNALGDGLRDAFDPRTDAAV